MGNDRTREDMGDSARERTVEQLLHGNYEAPQSPLRESGSEEESAGSDSAARGMGWRAVARALARHFRRVLRRMRAREFAQEHENEVLRRRLLKLIKQESQEDLDDDDDDGKLVDQKRTLSLANFHRKSAHSRPRRRIV